MWSTQECRLERERADVKKDSRFFTTSVRFFDIGVRDTPFLRGDLYSLEITILSFTALVA